ncbi:MAG: putative selenate reductase subunit YgfK [Oscillospiraceae bacterium]|nr:putative selenate reductase subunit YgfK [Oscillospiraceae bacterium]
MSDKMRQIPFGQLIDWALTEYAETGDIFGVSKIYKPASAQTLEIFGEKLEVPFGPAAGPHTQLAQNLIASYVAGGRFFELKTVQTLDGEDLPVSKPCILAQDEGYNVEWSTELYVPQALEEYIKGWFALKLLSKELEIGEPDGFIFNMSVGYDLEGIKSEKIDSYIEGLKDASHTQAWQACKSWALANLSRFKKVDKAYIEGINPKVSRSITLSTLHGCPPEEIERIAAYLLTEKKLHTFVKCNPTLLGYEYARSTMDKLGFDYLSFDDHHFRADLQFSDAVPMLGRLQELADSKSLSFGVKLTNTFPVKIAASELPGEEMYMSGRALFPLSIEVANRLTKAFDGKLRISYSGGADFHNIAEIYTAGIWPVTIATTLLKPGGYMRMGQMAEKLAAHNYKPFDGVSVAKVQGLVDLALTDPLYRKPVGLPPERKMNAEVPLVDCFAAPCRNGCPFEQDIPAYLRLAGEGKHLEALRVITERNPLPFITGTICSHRCTDKCTRDFYDRCVYIRKTKMEAAQGAYDTLMKEVAAPAKSGGKAAVVGGGPAGLAAAHFLARAGWSVTIFEKRDSLGGIVRHVIPGFRIGDNAIDNDIAFAVAPGVDVKLNSEITSLDELRAQGFDKVIVAVGAWKPGVLKLEGGEALGALEFLESLKSGTPVNLGENVVVVGGGNTAMDTARAAKRVPGVKKVSLVYRRTKRYMPADAEELTLALEDGVEFCELLAPVGLKSGVLTCTEMELGAPDASGRRSPVSTGRTVEVPADSVLSAIGDQVDSELYKQLGLPTDAKGKAQVNSKTLESELPGVYVIGDAMRGPATVAEAIADATWCAQAITGMSMDKYAGLNVNATTEPACEKKGTLCNPDSPAHESERCLECATVCECCVDVCPNRANVSLVVDGRLQIVHLDYMCNECGNCEEFCPYSSAPYKDKLTLFANAGDFEDSENQGFLLLDGGAVRVRLDGKVAEYRDGKGLPADIWGIIQAVSKKPYATLQE